MSLKRSSCELFSEQSGLGLDSVCCSINESRRISINSRLKAVVLPETFTEWTRQRMREPMCRSQFQSGSEWFFCQIRKMWKISSLCFRSAANVSVLRKFSFFCSWSWSTVLGFSKWRNTYFFEFPRIELSCSEVTFARDEVKFLSLSFIVALLELSTIWILRVSARAVHGVKTARMVCGRSEITYSTKRKISSTVLTTQSGSRRERSTELRRALSFVIKKLRVLNLGFTKKNQEAWLQKVLEN